MSIFPHKTCLAIGKLLASNKSETVETLCLGAFKHLRSTEQPVDKTCSVLNIIQNVVAASIKVLKSQTVHSWPKKTPKLSNAKSQNIKRSSLFTFKLKFKRLYQHDVLSSVQQHQSNMKKIYKSTSYCFVLQQPCFQVFLSIQCSCKFMSRCTLYAPVMA